MQARSHPVPYLGQATIGAWLLVLSVLYLMPAEQAYAKQRSGSRIVRAIRKINYVARNIALGGGYHGSISMDGPGPDLSHATRIVVPRGRTVRLPGHTVDGGSRGRSIYVEQRKSSVTVYTFGGHHDVTIHGMTPKAWHRASRKALAKGPRKASRFVNPYDDGD